MSNPKGFWWTARGLLIRSWILLALGQLMMLAALLTGLGALGAAGFLGITAVFVAARLLHKPWLLPGLGQPGGRRALSSEIAGQIVLVLVLFGIGNLIGRLTDWRPGMDLWQPLVVAGAAGLLMRLVWRPLPPGTDQMLDEATAALAPHHPRPAPPDDSAQP